MMLKARSPRSNAPVRLKPKMGERLKLPSGLTITLIPPTPSGKYIAGEPASYTVSDPNKKLSLGTHSNFSMALPSGHAKWERDIASGRIKKPRKSDLYDAARKVRSAAWRASSKKEVAAKVKGLKGIPRKRKNPAIGIIHKAGSGTRSVLLNKAGRGQYVLTIKKDGKTWQFESTNRQRMIARFNDAKRLLGIPVKRNPVKKKTVTRRAPVKKNAGTRRAKWYVGHFGYPKKSGPASFRKAFRCVYTPTEKSHGKRYKFVTGPLPMKEAKEMESLPRSMK